MDISISHPNKIIETLAMPSPMSAAMSEIPSTKLMRTIISVEERLYSTQRKRLRPFDSSLT